jgi:hypothetical protein
MTQKRILVFHKLACCLIFGIHVVHQQGYIMYKGHFGIILASAQNLDAKILVDSELIPS